MAHMDEVFSVLQKKVTFLTRFFPSGVLGTWQIAMSYIREIEGQPGLWETQEVHLVPLALWQIPFFSFCILHSR